MGYRVCAVMALLCTAAAQSACASKLDFDHVSAGRSSPDAGDSGAAASATAASATDASARGMTRADASSLETAVSRDAATAAFDASAPVLNPPSDAAPGRNSPADAGGQATDAGQLDEGLEPDPAAFSCARVSPEPYFCDDFESYLPVDHWDHVEVYPVTPLRGGSIGLDSSASRAGQSSLFVQVDEGVSSCASCLSLYTGLWLRDLEAPTQVTVEFDLRVEQIDPTQSRRIVLFQMVWGTAEAGFTHHTLQLESFGQGVSAGLVEFSVAGQSVPGDDPESTQIDHKFTPIPALDRWVHVRYTSDALDVSDASGVSNFAALMVDDAVLFVAAPQFALHSAKVHMEIGVPWVDMSTFAAQETSKSWQVRYDNVLVRYEPR